MKWTETDGNNNTWHQKSVHSLFPKGLKNQRNRDAARLVVWPSSPVGAVSSPWVLNPLTVLYCFFLILSVKYKGVSIVTQVNKYVLLKTKNRHFQLVQPNRKKWTTHKMKIQEELKIHWKTFYFFWDYLVPIEQVKGTELIKQNDLVIM